MQINSNSEMNFASLSRVKLKNDMMKFFLSSCAIHKPEQWFQTNWFVSQTSDDGNSHITMTLTKCHTFKIVAFDGENLRMKISWNKPFI